MSNNQPLTPPPNPTMHGPGYQQPGVNPVMQPPVTIPANPTMHGAAAQPAMQLPPAPPLTIPSGHVPVDMGMPEMAIPEQVAPTPPVMQQARVQANAAQQTFKPKNVATQIQTNPLSKLFRQPSIFMPLPSNGNYWKKDAIVIPQNGEVAVYPMTSRDEVILRTPDALINGQGMIDVIHSCIPDIKNAWGMPSTDVDAVLIAIRIASYGHQMDFDAECPHCGEVHTYSMDLRSMLDGIRTPNFAQDFEFDQQVVIRFKPQEYFNMNKINKMNFEIQKLAQAIEAIEDEDVKTAEAVSQMDRLIELNLEILADSTESITLVEAPDQSVTKRDFILEFYRNVPGSLVKRIQEAYGELAALGAVPKQQTPCGSCGQVFEMAVTFDYANFFAGGS